MYEVAALGEHLSVCGPATMSRSVITAYSTGAPTMFGTVKERDTALRACEEHTGAGNACEMREGGRGRRREENGWGLLEEGGH